MSVLDTGVYFGFQLQNLANQQNTNCHWYPVSYNITNYNSTKGAVLRPLDCNLNTRDDRKYATQTTATFQPWEGNLAVTQTWYCDDNGADKP